MPNDLALAPDMTRPKRLTVLHSYPVWLPRTQIWMYDQVRFLPADVVPHILCERTENRPEFGLENMHCLADRPAWSRAWSRGLRALRLHGALGYSAATVAACRPSILHSHFGHIGWSDMPLARRHGIAHVVTFYGLDVNYLPTRFARWRRRLRELLRHVDMVLCEGTHMAGRVAALGCPEAKIRVHRLGAAIDDVPYRPLGWQPGTPLRVLIAASFREKKGIPDALEALARLQRGIPIEVTLIGDAGEEPRAQAEKRRILETIARHGLQDTVRTLGYVPHERLLEEARSHHVFLSPSLTARDGDTEGGAPVSLIDMAASGTLVVSTRHCDIPEIVRDGETGLLAEERDVDGLVTKLEWLVAHPGAWEPMRAAARRHVEQNHSAPIQAARLAELYRTLAQ